ncbi:MAG: DUF1080 domain-containing protein, partial [Sphingobacteriales bacterium]
MQNFSPQSGKAIFIVLPCILLIGVLNLGCATQKSGGWEKWEQLFNGKDLKDWQIKIRHHDLNDNFANTFRVQDGNIQVRYDQYPDFGATYGHLFFKKPYSYYLIAAEYRFVGEQAKGGEGWAHRNSGIMIHGQD